MKRVLVCGGLIGLMLLSGCWKKENAGPSGAGWASFDPEHGQFSVAMPGTPTEQSLTRSAGKTWTSTADGVTYSVGYAELLIPPGAAETDNVEHLMDNDVEAMVATEGGQITGETKPLIVGGQPGREVDIEVDGKTLRRIRMCVVGDRLYSVEASGPKDKMPTPDINSFLDSFRVAK